MMEFTAIILAGGGGERCMGLRKQFVPVSGKPLVLHVADRFRDANLGIRQIVIVVPDDAARELCGQDYTCVVGGATRTDSIRNGLAAAEHDHILIHEGVRPYVATSHIAHVLRLYTGQPAPAGALFPVITTADFTDLALLDNRAIERERITVIQPPAVFPKKTLRIALEAANSYDAVETAVIDLADGWRGCPLTGINYKVTTYADLVLAQKGSV
jgi:2-C-methyl-D-erythritol 4-phosphate cytidylyltransferase